MKKNLEDLFKKTEERFGLNNACFLFDYVARSIPKRRYYTLKGVYSYMNKELEGFYDIKEGINSTKFKKYGIF